MYYTELIGALLLTCHACLLIACVDYIKNASLINKSIIVTKVLLILYAILILMRTILYFLVHSDVLNHDRLSADQGFGNFLASYMVRDKTAALWITIVLLGIFGICFLLQFLQYRWSKRLAAYIKTIPERRSSSVDKSQAP